MWLARTSCEGASCAKSGQENSNTADTMNVRRACTGSPNEQYTCKRGFAECTCAFHATLLYLSFTHAQVCCCGLQRFANFSHSRFLPGRAPERVRSCLRETRIRLCG